VTLFCVARQARSYGVGPTGLGGGVWGLRSQMTMFVAGRRVRVFVCHRNVLRTLECFAYRPEFSRYRADILHRDRFRAI